LVLSKKIISNNAMISCLYNKYYRLYNESQVSMIIKKTYQRGYNIISFKNKPIIGTGTRQRIIYSD